MISLQSKGLSQVSNITTQKHQIFAYRLLYGPALTSVLRRRGLQLVHLGAAERIYPMSEVRGRSQEDPMPEGQLPKGVTPCPRSGAEARRTPCPKGSCQKELPHVRGQGLQPRVPGRDSTGMAEKSYPSPRSGVAAERSYPMPKARGGVWEELPHAPMPEVRGSGWEDQPHIQGVVAV